METKYQILASKKNGEKYLAYHGFVFSSFESAEAETNCLNKYFSEIIFTVIKAGIHLEANSIIL